MSKFKVGDRVRRTGDTFTSGIKDLKVGNIDTISDISSNWLKLKHCCPDEFHGFAGNFELVENKKFKVGDIVSFKDENSQNAIFFKHGLENLEIMGANNYDYRVYESDKSDWWCVKEDELEFATPKTETKFKVGDRVRLIYNHCYSDINIGDIGTVTTGNTSSGWFNIDIKHYGIIYRKGIKENDERWELLTPKTKLIEKTMDIEDIKAFSPKVLADAEKQAKEELAKEQTDIVVARFKELLTRISDAERAVVIAQKKLDDLKGKADAIKPKK